MARFDVLISYSSKNKAVADAVVSNFEQNGIRCWYAPRDILPGKEWVAAIKEGIYSARVFILLFTEESNASRQVMNEVAMAFNAEKTIVPFKLTQKEMSDELEYYLTRVHWLDAVSRPLADHIEELRKYVELILSGTNPGASVDRELLEKSGRAGRTGDGNDGGYSGNNAIDAGKPNKKRGIILACIAAALVIAGVILWILNPFKSGRQNNNQNTPTGEVTPTREPDKYEILVNQGEEYYQSGDYDNALDCFQKAVDGGVSSTVVYYRIGTIYLSGKSGKGVDVEKALEYLELAYHDGKGENLTADEYYMLAYKYDTEESVKDPEKAFIFARNGAVEGSIQCMLMTGEAYWYGNGVKQNYNKVLEWFGKALDSGAEGYTRNYCINCIATLVEEGHVTREAASKWLGEE